MNLNLGPEYASCMAVLAAVVTLATVILHIAFAVGVYLVAADSKPRVRTWFVSPFFWGLATLLGGVFVATAYWAIHHSRLRLKPRI